jgi:hypothetical protein
MLKNMMEELNSELGNTESTAQLDIVAKNFSIDELNYLYNLGVKQVQIKNYAKALPIFELLNIVDNMNALYSKALAGCHHAMGDYANALFKYKFTYLLDSEKESDCLFYSGVCLYEAEMFERAEKEFNDYLQKQNKSVEFSGKTALYLQAIKQKIAENNQEAQEA